MQNSLSRTRYMMRKGIRVVRKANMENVTLSMDPQKGSLCVPLSEDALLEEPRGSSILMDFASNVVVFRRIWRAEPISGFLLQLVPCNSL